MDDYKVFYLVQLLNEQVCVFGNESLTQFLSFISTWIYTASHHKY